MNQLDNEGLTPKGRKVVNRQKFAFAFSVFTVPLLISFFLSHYLGISYVDVSWWLVILPLSYVGITLLSNLLTIVAVLSVYGIDSRVITEELQLMKNELQQTEAKAEASKSTELIELTIIKKPEKPIARFLDEDIFEWLEFSANGKHFTGYFEGTLNMKSGMTFSIPDNCILIDPGVLYKIQFKETNNGQQEKIIS